MNWSWNWEPLIVAGVAIAAFWYWMGATEVRMARWRVASYYAGLALILVALVSPLATAAEQLFVAHMLQHIVLVMFAAPLVLLGAPAVPFARGLPRAVRDVTVRPLARSRVFHAAVALLTDPLVALGLYVVLLSGWHVPALYDAAANDTVVHALEHLTFIFISLLFWNQVIDPYPFRARLGHPLRIVLLFFATVQGSALGAVLAFSGQPLYAHYAAITERPFGLTAVTDQQAGGALMWVLGGILYLAAISLVFAAWMNSEDRAEPRGDVSSPALQRHV